MESNVAIQQEGNFCVNAVLAEMAEMAKMEERLLKQDLNQLREVCVKALPLRGSEVREIKIETYGH